MDPMHFLTGEKPHRSSTNSSRPADSDRDRRMKNIFIPIILLTFTVRTSGTHAAAPKDAKRADFFRQILEGITRTDEAMPTRQLDFSSKVLLASSVQIFSTLQPEIIWFFDQMKANTRVGTLLDR